MSLLNDASLVFIPSGYKEDKVYSIIPSNGAGDLDFVRGCDATRINPQSLVENTPWNLVQYSEDFTNAAWGKYQASITGNAITAPNGTLSADFIYDNTANDVHITYQNKYLEKGYNTISVYAKANTLSNIVLQFFDGTSGYISNKFDLSNGTTTGANQSIESVGNGWYRCIFSANLPTSANTLCYVLLNNGSSNSYIGSGQGVYIWGYQINSGLTAKPYFPTTDRLNVPRLTYSPTLIERQSTNLALWSQEFDNGAWGKSECSINANQTTAPDGTLTADKLIESSNNAIHEVYSNSPIALTAGVAYTKSVYAKAAERTEVSLNFVTGGFGQGSAVIANLSNGTLGSISNYGGVTGSTATITDVSNGWYRISLTMTPVTSQTFYVDFSPSLSGNRIYTGNGTSGIYIWGAQLETGALSSYIPTTSTAVTRTATYNSGCPSLLLEKQSTNLALWSEEFDNAWWGKVKGGVALIPVVTANAEIAPDGTNSADRIVFSLNGGTASGDISQLESATYTSISLTRTQSFYIKTTDGTTKVFSFVSPTGTLIPITVTSTYQRFTYTTTGLAAGTIRLRLRGSGEGTATTASIAIWGAQYEDGAYPTSYIPTTSATATRLADSCYKNGISSLIGQTEGTMFIDFYYDISNPALDTRFQLSDGTTNKWIFLGYPDGGTNGLARCLVNNVPTGILSFFSNNTLVSGRNKLAFAYKSGDFVLYMNGVLDTANTTTFPIPATSELIINGDIPSGSKTSQEKTRVNQALLFKRRLTNTELEKLTTL